MQAGTPSPAGGTGSTRKRSGKRPRKVSNAASGTAAAATAGAGGGTHALAEPPAEEKRRAPAPDLSSVDPLLEVMRAAALEELTAAPARQRPELARRHVSAWRELQRREHTAHLERIRDSVAADREDRHAAVQRYLRNEDLMAQIMTTTVPQRLLEGASSPRAGSAPASANGAPASANGGTTPSLNGGKVPVALGDGVGKVPPEVSGPSAAAIASLDAALDLRRKRSSWQSASELVQTFAATYGTGGMEPRAKRHCEARDAKGAFQGATRATCVRVPEPDITAAEAVAATSRVVRL